MVQEVTHLVSQYVDVATAAPRLCAPRREPENSAIHGRYCIWGCGLWLGRRPRRGKIERQRMVVKRRYTAHFGSTT